MSTIKEASIPNLMLKEGTERSKIDAIGVFSSWMTKMQSAVSSGDSSKLSDLFVEDSWWRDVITLSWDIRSVHGEKIANCIQQAHEAGLTNLVPRSSGVLVPQVGELGPFTLVEGAFSFETKIGRGNGYLRLCNTASNEWKAWIIMTSLQEIKGHEELLKKSAPPYWSNAVDDAKYEAESQKSPHVLIVGAGHSALSLCARLKQLGISALMVDKTERVGDSWRLRYMNLCLHDPKWENHQPYLRFPDTFPAWIPRKQLADWLEHYQSVMQLPIKMNSTVSKAQWNADSKTWTVDITAKDGSKTTLNPHHVVLATGLHSDEGRIPDFPGLDSFKGPIIHSTKYTTASDVPDHKSKKFVVIGSSSSSHDICQDLAEAGCDVTMVQRDVNAVYSLNAKNNVVGAPYMKPGISTEEADILTASMPFPVVMTMMIGGQAMMYQMDKELMDRVGKTEFKFLKGDDGRSLLHLIFTKGGGHYPDQGSLELIANGKIKVKQCYDGVEKLTPDGLVLADGRKVEADVIVMATGYKFINDAARKFLGDEVVAKSKLGISFNEDNELNGLYTTAGHEGLWWISGSMAMNRSGSLNLALQIKAAELGLNPYPANGAN